MYYHFTYEIFFKEMYHQIGLGCQMDKSLKKNLLKFQTHFLLLFIVISSSFVILDVPNQFKTEINQSSFSRNQVKITQKLIKIMENIPGEINRIIEESEKLFKNFSDDDWNYRSAPNKWSKKEILGHLIDSALTNLRRFVMTQYLENQNIVYQIKCTIYVGSYFTVSHK